MKRKEMRLFLFFKLALHFLLFSFCFGAAIATFFLLHIMKLTEKTVRNEKGRWKNG